ncbi:MAG: NACHT domain-containing NTPase, partial [Pirellulales bacterium]
MSRTMDLPSHAVPRFWCPRDGRFFLGDGGYLSDPCGEAREMLNPDLVAYSEISERSCLVLLGEPGIGKTTALGQEREAVERRVAEKQDLLIWQDLSVYDQGDAPRLRDDIFGDPQWTVWRDSDRTLQLYLDSFDECRLYLRNVANVLLDGLRRLPHCERILFRLACRTGAWSQHLEDGFSLLWGDTGVGVYELAPLRRTDVEDIARAGGIENTDGFLHEVEKSNAVPFAIKPVTLNFLIALYMRDGRFPPTQAQLYEDGCRALCEEPSPSRRSAGELGLLDEKRRQSVASRIAAMTVFCGKDAVWVGADLGRRPKTDLSLVEIAGGMEAADGDHFEVSAETAREVVCETGLFTSRGANRMGWAHRTYAEYLAA